MMHRRSIAPRALVTLLALGAAALPAAGPARGAEDAPQPPSPLVHISAKGLDIHFGVPRRLVVPRIHASVPKQGDRYDYPALRASLTTLRGRYPKLPALTLAPEPEIPWDVVVQVIAHARKDAKGKPLFPVITLAYQSY